MSPEKAALNPGGGGSVVLVDVLEDVLGEMLVDVLVDVLGDVLDAAARASRVVGSAVDPAQEARASDATPIPSSW